MYMQRLHGNTLQRDRQAHKADCIRKRMRKPRRRQILSRRADSDTADSKGEVMSEAQEQIAVMRWAELQSHIYPELNLLFHIPNGSNKSKAQAGLFKAMGLKSGVPDLFLPVARQCYHGLFIEMKTKKGVLSTSQEWWLFELQKQGYRVDIARSFEEAIETLRGYLR